MKAQKNIRMKSIMIVSIVTLLIAVTNQMNSQSKADTGQVDETDFILSWVSTENPDARDAEISRDATASAKAAYTAEAAYDEKLGIEPWMEESAYWKNTTPEVMTDEVVEEELQIEPWMLKANFGKDETMEAVLKEVEEKPLEIEDWMLKF